MLAFRRFEWSWISRSVSAVCDLVFPPVCSFCSRDLEERSSLRPHHELEKAAKEAQEVELSLCEECRQKLQPEYSQKCQSCGAGILLASESPNPTKIATTIAKCMYCRRSDFKFRTCYSLGNYELGIREAVLGVKSGVQEGLIADLAKLMVHSFSLREFDLVVPIPIHWRRRLGRRVVVPDLLSEKIARLSKTPNCQKALRYQRLTSKQGTLSTTERVKNVHGAIQVARPDLIKNKHVLIVDDVMTSGATLNEAASVCLRSRASEISVAVVARGVGRSTRR